MTNKTPISSRWFRISQYRRFVNGKVRGKPIYMLSLTHRYTSPDMVVLDDFHDAVRDIVDPFRSRSGKNGTSWKYDSKARAEKDYLMLVMKWS